MNIVELLKLRGLDTSANIKLVRHQDKRYNLQELYSKNKLDIYQSYQGKDVFNCDYVVSFLGTEGTRAVFIGVYQVLGKKDAKEVEPPENLLDPVFYQDSKFFYELKPLEGFEDYKDRLIIDWGSATLSWHQYLSEKEVIEILPKGYVKEFPGFLDFILSYYELKKLISNPEANREWHRMLSSVGGIYLIVDKLTGKQYVGSAYGEDGIWGRWANYAKSGHGGNELLKKLLENNQEYCDNFLYSILQTLPKHLTKNEIIQKESFFKEKLGSRAFGLNIT